MSTSKQIALFSALAFSTVALNATAGVGKGDFEAGASVSISNTETTVNSTSTDSDTGLVAGNLGYFFTDILEAKVSISAITSTSTNPTTGASTKTTTGIFSPGLDAVFLGTKTVAPFVGGSYGLAFGDTVGTVDSDFYEAHGGIKFFVKERASLEVKLTKFEPTDSAAQNGRTELSVGLNIYF